ncbi:methylenetetrahydrofolate reductase [NAD(P)H] [Clostridium hydrogeniformans]|uniref:methylenetetrahydrofolate reductase [NAD(P)H] n=1 Tax=Clostridium hydrogeniformans TaxID=349933 RepID=UPI000483E869|nr:methylenetetrahydrofolate reductase [NAD(P)H] [Clostridium hydrogeniformans]
MNISKKFNEKEVVFSFEVFPPKDTTPIESIYGALDKLTGLNPDFLSVTYGAGGSLKNNKTCMLSSYIKNSCKKEALAHLTCIGSTKDEIDFILKELKDNNIENILALRGDIREEDNTRGDFKYGHELISYIKSKGNFRVVASCYPEGHAENKNIEKEIENTKRKLEAGADSFISQLFFDNEIFLRYLESCYSKGINAPIQAGIMPVINKNQINRIASLCRVNIPKKFLRIMDKYGHDKEALKDAGIAYATEQIVDLVSSGVQGIHLYTMNNVYVATKINENLSTILKSINNKIAI